jgi:hypothetical protein
MNKKWQDEYNMILMLNRGLGDAIKTVVEDDIVKQQLKEFEAKLRPIVKEEVEKLTFESIDKAYGDLEGMLTLRNELRVYISWSDDEKASMMEKLRRFDVVEERITKTVVDK